MESSRLVDAVAAKLGETSDELGLNVRNRERLGGLKPADVDEVKTALGGSELVRHEG